MEQETENSIGRTMKKKKKLIDQKTIAGACLRVVQVDLTQE